MDFTSARKSRISVQPKLQLVDISKNFPGVKALNGVAIDLYPGEIHMLLGENGAGKSTLVKIIAGVLKPDFGGRILLDQKPTEIGNPRQSRALGIAVIHQELSLIPGMNAVSNMMLGRELCGAGGQLRHQAMEELCIQALQKLDVPLNVNCRVELLSIAQQQVVEITAALLGECRVLVLDEPTSALSHHEVAKLGHILASLKAQGVAILYISHRFEEIFRFGDRATVLRDGKVVGTRLLSDTSRGQLISMMIGRDLIGTVTRHESKIGEPLLVVEGLCSPSGIRDIHLTVHRGEIVSLAGLMGSGRSKVAHALFGADPQAVGAVFVRGQKLSLRSIRRAITMGMALVPEDRRRLGLILTLSAGENISLTALSKICNALGRISRSREKANVLQLIKQLQVKLNSPRQSAATLSGGNQQKLVVAKWLNSDAALFIFDEPTRGIDMGTKQEIYRIMRGLVAGGAGVLMISSDLPEVLELSDRIVVMRNGQNVGEILRHDATPDRIMNLATG